MGAVSFLPSADISRDRITPGWMVDRVSLRDLASMGNINPRYQKDCAMAEWKGPR